jgi:Ca2+-binding EF-hand superfamily protein
MTVSKKPIALLALGLAIAGTATLTIAQTPPPGGGQPGARHAKIDANGDGVIDRSEAAKAPRLAENFDRLDANKDGKIGADERPQRGAGRGGHGGPGGAMAKLDANGDGAIDRSEAAKSPRLAENFDRLDANKDGRIGADERPQRGGRQGGMRDGGMRDGGMRDGGKGRGGERMAQLDKNGDGRFSRDELAGRERALQNFAAIDTNKDGFLTREEMQAHHKAARGERKPKP